MRLVVLSRSGRSRKKVSADSTAFKRRWGSRVLPISGHRLGRDAFG